MVIGADGKIKGKIFFRTEINAMSDPILYINNYAVPYAHVKKWPSVSESISYDSSLNISDGWSVELDNSDPNDYDPKYSGSLLYGTKIKKISVAIYEPDLLSYTAYGVIDNVSTDNSAVTIDVVSQLSAVAENDVQIVETGMTPADVIYKMLTSPKTLGSTTPLIDPSFIDMSSFRYASNLQMANRCTIDINILKSSSDAKKYGDVIPELLKIGHCYIYTHYDRIYLWQYSTRKNPSILIDSVVAGSYRDYYQTDEAFKIKNSYNIIYKNGAGVSAKIDKDNDSIDDYGESIFGVPSDDVDSTSSTDFNALIDNPTGAKWCGDIALERYGSLAKGCDFALNYKYHTIKVGDIIGLDFEPFDETPVLVLEADYDKTGDKIEFKALFL
jgi:hypothetical protein